MTVRQTNVVDWLGIEKETGHVILTIVDDLDWTDEADHLRTLQDKLNTYLAFIESGEVYEALIERLSRSVDSVTPMKVSILARHVPTADGEAFLEHARAVFEQAGLHLAHKVLAVTE